MSPPDLTAAEAAWVLMKAGNSLQQAALALNVDPKRLDKSIWLMRARRTNSRHHRVAA